MSTIKAHLARLFPDASATTLRRMVSDHRVILNDAVVKSLRQAIEPADIIRIDDHGSATRPLSHGLAVVFDDGEVLVVDKPAGLLTATHEDEARPTALALLQAFVRQYNPRAHAFLVHRLDQDASGLLVFARTVHSLKELKKQFAAHTVTRQYAAAVHGTVDPPAGRLEHTLFEGDDQIVRVVPDGHGKPAIMDFRTIAANKTHSLLECTLYTGRKHQIRVQLRAAGHPVCGDRVYGTAAAREGREFPHRLALHATLLSFTHPRTKKTLTFESPMPRAFRHVVAKKRK